MKINTDRLIIVGAEECTRCDILHNYLPDVPIYKIPNRTLGLGDTIARFTDVLRIPSCRSCKIRRSFLNNIFPYFWRAPKHVRFLRNKVLKHGKEELPVLLDISYNFLYNVDDYVPGFTKKYFKDQ